MNTDFGRSPLTDLVPNHRRGRVRGRRSPDLRQFILCLMSAGILACASCSSNHKLYPVCGRVTYRGTPAAGATVFFQHRGGDALNDPMVMGIAGEDGSFELVCGSLGNGAPPGDYDVLIEWKPVAGRSNGRPQRGSDRLQGRYADRRHPLLHATVEARANNLPPFELTDAGSMRKR